MYAPLKAVVRISFTYEMRVPFSHVTMHWKCQHRNIGVAVTSERAVSAAHPPRFIREIVNLVPRGCSADNSTCITGCCNFYSVIFIFMTMHVLLHVRIHCISLFYTARFQSRNNARHLMRFEYLAGLGMLCRVKHIHHLCKFTRLLISYCTYECIWKLTIFYRIRFGHRACNQEQRL